MNYLAHVYLSGENDEIRLGNFISDSVKGRQYNEFPDLIRKGIILHRKIDEFTDNHPVYRQSRDRFKPGFHKYAGVVTDIFYDHLLLKNWAKYSSVSSQSFIRHVYVLAFLNYPILPVRVQKFLPFMILRDWLGTYRTIEGIDSIFERMAKRTTLPAESGFAIKVIRENYEEFDKEFNIFFDEIIDFVKDLGFDIIR
ncbi:MAG: DUF479 domain-containing protein [Bacteroidales bacterium]|nr:DUF479 domain-containing protein [Bacteroidales bacterium]